MDLEQTLWHRNPRGADGRPRKSLGPMAEEMTDLDNYTFPVSEEYKKAYKTASGLISQNPISSFNFNENSTGDSGEDTNEQSLDVYASLSENS